jgi:hypothetical protein
MADRRLGAAVVSLLVITGLFVVLGQLNAGSADGAAVDPAWSSLPPAASDGPLLAVPDRVGEFVARCGFSHRALDDPIVHRGRPGRSHSHDFFGNETTDANSTIEALLAGPTTCDKRSDTAAYWAPTLYHDGEPVTPELGSAYYRGVVGVDVSRSVAPPPGLVMIAGDSLGERTPTTSTAAWACGERGELVSVSAPPTCSSRSKLTMHIQYTDCWDGRRLDSGDHRGHVAHSTEGTCPTSHPVAMAQLVFVISYPISGDPGDLRLASGDLATAHADFMNAWDQDVLVAETRYCINRNVTCSV